MWQVDGHLGVGVYTSGSGICMCVVRNGKQHLWRQIGNIATSCGGLRVPTTTCARGGGRHHWTPWPMPNQHLTEAGLPE